MPEVNIGPKIRQLRRQAGMTQVEFASRIGVTNITVSKWENERQTPSLNRLAKLERVLGANPGDRASGDCPSPPTGGSWLNQTGVTAVMTGVVISLKAGISMPEACEAEDGSPPDARHVTIDVPQPGPGTGPGVRLQQGATGEADSAGDRATVVTEEILGESTAFNLHGPDLTGKHSASSGVGELIDFDPHDPGEHPALSGIYVLYDISERPLYVGQAKSIDKRIRDHNDKFWFRSPIVETASYVQIDDKELRERVEAVLIKFLKRNAVINKRLVDR